MKKNEDISNEKNKPIDNDHYTTYQAKNESNISLNLSLNKSNVDISNNCGTPSNKKLKSNSQITSFFDTTDESQIQNTQNTLLKLHSIVKEKSNLITIQKERIEKLNKKLDEDQISLSKLRQNYQEHQSSLSELQLKNQILQQNFDELESKYTIESQNILEKKKQIDLDTEKVNKEIILYEQKIAKCRTEDSINDSKIDLALKSKDLMIKDNETVKSQIIELENYKTQCCQFELKIPAIQERINQIQHEISQYTSLINNNKAQIDQLTKENYLLKNQAQEESKVLQVNQNEYTKLKKEVDLKLQLQNKFNVLQENLSKNKKIINEAEQYIQNKDESLNSLKKINKQKLKENISMKNHLLSLQNEMNIVKHQLIQLTIENANSKQALNNRIEEFVNNGITKSEKKITELHQKEKKMKKEVENMKNIVKKLESDINSIMSMHNEMNDEKLRSKPENVPTFDFSDINLSNLQKSIQNLEDNNDVISFLIEDNHNQEENLKKSLKDEDPILPKQTVEEKAKKYGLF